jgi:hypothetical protein
VPQPAVIPFYACSVLFPCIMGVSPERGDEAVPSVSCDQDNRLFPTGLSAFSALTPFQAAFSPHRRGCFLRIAMIGVNKPYSLFCLHISGIRLSQGNYSGFASALSRISRFEHFRADAYFQCRVDVPYARSAD